MPARQSPPPGDYLIVAYGGFSRWGWWTNGLAGIYRDYSLTPQALPANQPRGGHPRSRAKGPFGVGPLPHP